MRTLLSLLTVSVFGCVAAGEPPRVAASRLSTTPTIDGTIDSEEWKDAAHLTAFTDPLTGRLAVDQTEVRLGFNEKAIYVAFYAHDTKPDGIVGREIQPGAEFNGEDTVTLRINPFGTRDYGGRSRFTVNVLNTQSDEIAGGRAAKKEWRGEWTSAVRRVADGYTVEICIPWKVLNHPVGEARSMDLNLERFQARTQSLSQWANTTVSNRPELAGVWEGVTPPTPVANRWKFLAYTAPEFDAGTFGLHSGLDARYALTSQLTALASFAPDFKNIEGEIAGVNFTRTERYLDETRPFFTEGGGFFDIGSYPFGYAQMFYSRRIQNFDMGGKAFGQVNKNFSIGALSTLDFQNQNASVVKLSQSFGPRNGANVFLTQLNSNAENNLAVGGTLYGRKGNFGGDISIAAEGSGTNRMDIAGNVNISYEVPHWSSFQHYEWIKPNFAPPLAYVPWTDRRGWYSFNEWSSDFRDSWIREANAHIYLDNFRTYADEEQVHGGDFGCGFTTRADWHLGYNFTQESYSGELERLHYFEFALNKSNRFRQLGGSCEIGTRGTEKSEYYNLNGSLRLLKGCDLGLTQSVNHFGGNDSLTIATLGYELSPTKSITGRYVHRAADRNFYLAYRDAGQKGMETFFILGDPNADKFRMRMSVKLVWAF